MAEKVEIIAELKDLVSGRFADINKQIEAMDSKLDRMNAKGSGGGGVMGQVLGADLLGSAIKKAGSAIIDFGKDSFYAFGRSEQFLTSLTTMFHGNKEEAKALDQQLKNFALESPMELTEIRDATKMMIAYGSSSGSVVEEMRMLGDISSGVGSSLSEVAYLYGTMRTQGRAFARDIYQFTGRGIPIVKELAKQFKVTDSQVMQLVTDGKVGFKEIEKAMQSLTTEGGQFHDMMKAQSKTLLGQTSNLADAWDQLKSEIGKSQEGILKGTVSWMTKMIQQMLRATQESNFRDKVNGNLKGGVKTGWSLLSGNFLNMEDSPIDKQFAKFQAYQKYHNENNDGKSYASFSEYQKHSRNDFGPGRGTEEIFKSFSNELFDKFQDLGKSGDVGLASAKFQVELVKERAEILNMLKERTISSQLAISKFAVLDELIKDAKGLSGMSNSKSNKEDKQPADLEKAAKTNKATQIIVNIENLVRELTNVNNRASDLNQLTTDGTLKALTVAVNNIYATGQ